MILVRKAVGGRNLGLVVLAAMLSSITLAFTLEGLIVAVALVGMHATGFPIAVLAELVLQRLVAGVG